MLKISSKDYYNKVLGSWLGRVAGDFVGAPVEFQPYSLIKEKYGDITHYPEPIDLNHVNDDEMYEICALIALENTELISQQMILPKNGSISFINLISLRKK